MKNSTNELVGFDDFLNIRAHNKVWSNLLKLRENMIERNLSLNEVREFVKQKRIKGIDLNSLSEIGNLSIYYTLFSVVAFKEQYEALVDIDIINSDESQREFLKKFPNIDGHIELLTRLRNCISHAGFKVSRNGDKVSSEYVSFSGAELKKYLNSMMKAMLKSNNTYKMATATRNVNLSRNQLKFLPFKGAESLVYNLLNAESFSLQSNKKEERKELGGNKLCDKLMVIMMSEKLNKLTLENPDAKWDEIKKMMLESISEYNLYPNIGDIKKMFKNENQILDVDAMIYAQYVLSSKCYDKSYDYEGALQMPDIEEPLNKVIEDLRNCVAHGIFELTPKQTILCKGLNSQGYDHLREVRRQRRDLADDEIQIVLRNSPVFVTDNVETKVELNRDEVLALCGGVADIFEKRCQKKYQKKCAKNHIIIENEKE